MPQLPLLSGKQLIKILAQIGYSIQRQRGSHIRLSASGKKSVTVPNYKQIDRSLLIKILRDAKLKPEDFSSLL